jgi:hypothetical protein
MDTIITAVISTVITAIITASITLSLPEWIRFVKTIETRKKRHKLIINTVIKYPFFAALIAVIFFFVPFGKLFVLLMCVAVLIFSYFIARDIFMYFLKSFFISGEKEKTENEIELWINQLAMCSPDDKNRIEMIKTKLNEFKKELAKL